MQRALLSLGIAGALSLPAAAVNAQTPAAPASPHTFTGNLTFASDYRFRGISQTFKKPAVQGGFDYSHASGLYLGTWASNVSGVQYPNGNSMEWDFYGGYKGTIYGDLGFDIGGLYYWYPGSKFNDTGRTKPNNFELYAGLSWKWISLKYSHSLTDFFGVKTSTFGGSCGIDSTNTAFTAANAPDGCIDPDPGNSKGSGYLDLSASYEIMPKLTLVGHVGHQKVRHYGRLDYTDWKLGVTYDLNGWLLGAAYVDTNAREPFYRAANGVGDVKELGKSTLVVSVGKTF